MSSAASPKDQQRAAGQSIFADLNPKRTTNPDSPSAKAPGAPIPPDKLKAILEKSYRDGYERGMKEGYANGMDLAKQGLANDKNSLRDIAMHFSAALDRKGEHISEEILNLSLDIAKAMLKTQLQVKPEVMLGVIKDVIARTPIATKPMQLFLHPHDAAIVRAHLQDELTEGGWVIVEEDGVDRGGCMVETSSNTIDASNQGRWKRLCDALGARDDWLEGTS